MCRAGNSCLKKKQSVSETTDVALSTTGELTGTRNGIYLYIRLEIKPR